MKVFSVEVRYGNVQIFNNGISYFMKINQLYYIIFLLFVTPLFAQSICQEQLEISDGVSGLSIGQSIFMPECSGFFSSITLNRSEAGPEVIAELLIMNGQTYMGTPLYTQSVTIPASSGPFTIDLAGGDGELSFFEDSQYTFLLNSATLQLQASTDIDSYSDGQLFLDAGFINNDDLWFQLRTTTTLGIIGHELEKPKLYPNPAQRYIQLSGVQASENYWIYNALGMPIKKGSVGTHPIAIQQLPNGLYFLRLEAGHTLKFLKN